MVCHARSSQSKRGLDVCVAARGLARGEVALTVAEVAQALLQVQRHRVVDLAADPLALEMTDQPVAFSARLRLEQDDNARPDNRSRPTSS